MWVWVGDDYGGACFFFNDPATTEIYTLSLHDALPISGISLIGSLVVTGADYSPLSAILGTIAVACSSTNLVGGFLITDRMLKMFKRKGDQVDRARQRLAAGPILWGAVTVAVAVLLILAGAGRLTPGPQGRRTGVSRIRRSACST